MRKLATVYLAFLMLFGCATDQFQRHETTAKLVTQYAVLKYAERLPEEQKVERIARIRTIATDVKALASGDTTLLALHAVVNQQLDKAGLTAADRLLANGLVDIIVAELQARIGDGVLSAEQRVQVTTVLDWVIQATALA
jgi:hypothetical protein